MKTPLFCTSTALVLLLTACSGSTVKDTLGISRSAPDEFRVVSRPPLSVPPQFNLRPPSSSAESPIAKSADKEAQSLVLGVPAEESNTFRLQPADTAVTPVMANDLDGKGKVKSSASSGESLLLQNAGANRADPGVRQVLVEERIQKIEPEEERAWWEVWSDKDKEPLVNAKDEAERIKTNTDQGKPITEGETPEVKAKDTGVLGKIFGY